jgi:hypothetical protein
MTNETTCTARTDAATRSRAEGGNTSDCAKYDKDYAAIASKTKEQP